MSLIKNECEKFRALVGITNYSHELNIMEESLSSRAEELLQTRPLQILQKRKQLGFLNQIMPNWGSPEHTRFEHTVGVMAKCLVASDQINNSTKVERDSDSNKNCFTILDVAELVAAAAIHDCGHLPLSHVTERAILAHHGNRYGARHEERIVPMLLNGHDFFEEYIYVLQSWNLWDGDDDKFRNSLFRIAYLLHPHTATQQLANKDHRKLKDNLIRPKMAIEQLLSSELDMDRLDYLIRDSDKLEYKPVKQLDSKIASLINGLFLVEAESISSARPENNLELCIKNEYLENVFFMLVARVLLYKYRYFDSKIRRFEGALTYLISELLGNGASIQTIELMMLGDDEFIQTKLVDIIEKTYFKDSDRKDNLIKLLENIKRGHSNRYEYVGSIDRDKIENPRLKEEFSQKSSSFKYIKQLQIWLSDKAGVGEDCLLLDSFTLKPGEGKFLVQAPKSKEKNCSNDGTEFKLLKDFMNGSNLHRLCSQLRLDVYVHTEQNEQTKNKLKEQIKTFGKLDRGD